MSMTDAWICDFVRTPVGRYGGALARLRTDDLAAIPIRALIQRHPNLADSIDEVMLGCANQAGEDNRNVARMAALLAGLPESVPGVTLNRLCASGLEAVGTAARAVQLNELHLAIAGGVESMSRSPWVMAKPEDAFQRSAELVDSTIGWRFVNPMMEQQFGSDSMPETAENVADEFSVSRADQDAFAFRSQHRTRIATDSGLMKQDIIPVNVPTGKKGETCSVELDEHPRPNTTLDTLAKLRPITRKDGTITAGNASGVNDGAAAVLIASTSQVEKFSLTPLARFVGMAAAGVPPRIMGIGPVPAVQKLLSRLKWKISDVDVIELNEAFASQSLACLRQLGLPDDAENVNPNGGAIAVGHPLGMSGTRILGMAVRELVRRSGKRAIATMCTGVGQGLAIAIERPNS